MTRSNGGACVMSSRSIATVVALIGCCMASSPAKAQQVQDPENGKQFALWLDQAASAALAKNKSFEAEVHERFDEGASHLFEYFVQAGVAFRLRPWLTVTPIYRYQRFPGNPTLDYEHRLLLNITTATSRGAWRPSLRTLVEERFPEGRPASARLRFRPGVDYVLPIRMTRPPVLVVTNEFFVVPGENSFAAGGSFAQNRFQVGVRVPMTSSLAVRPYFMWQSVNQTTGWETNEIVGISFTVRSSGRTK